MECGSEANEDGGVVVVFMGKGMLSSGRVTLKQLDCGRDEVGAVWDGIGDVDTTRGKAMCSVPVEPRPEVDGGGNPKESIREGFGLKGS